MKIWTLRLRVDPAYPNHPEIRSDDIQFASEIRWSSVAYGLAGGGPPTGKVQLIDSQCFLLLDPLRRKLGNALQSDTFTQRINTVLQEMDPIRQRELIERRAAAKQTAKQNTCVTMLKSLLSPLDAVGVRYILIPKADGQMVGLSALAALESFPFDAHGHLEGDRHVPTPEWRSVFTDEFIAGRRAYLAWKDQDCCIDVLLSDILPVLSDVFLDYHWDAYLFDPFGSWIIESHHDGYLSIKDAEQAAGGRP